MASSTPYDAQDNAQYAYFDQAQYNQPSVQMGDEPFRSHYRTGSSRYPSLPGPSFPVAQPYLADTPPSFPTFSISPPPPSSNVPSFPIPDILAAYPPATPQTSSYPPLGHHSGTQPISFPSSPSYGVGTPQEHPRYPPGESSFISHTPSSSYSSGTSQLSPYPPHSNYLSGTPSFPLSPPSTADSHKTSWTSDEPVTPLESSGTYYPPEHEGQYEEGNGSSSDSDSSDDDDDGPQRERGVGERPRGFGDTLHTDLKKLKKWAKSKIGKKPIETTRDLNSSAQPHGDPPQYSSRRSRPSSPSPLKTSHRSPDQYTVAYGLAAAISPTTLAPATPNLRYGPGYSPNYNQAFNHGYNPGCGYPADNGSGY
ncbi:hypothetical protein FRB97_005841 [Tulasnella sp. 331]|nr:hypothetical protein FRB97_005841 [Tulasnella sp. 331]